MDAEHEKRVLTQDELVFRRYQSSAPGQDNIPGSLGLNQAMLAQNFLWHTLPIGDENCLSHRYSF
jgi:hypothetical protein